MRLDTCIFTQPFLAFCVTVSRPSNDLFELGGPSTGGTTTLQYNSYFQPSGIPGQPSEIAGQPPGIAGLPVGIAGHPTGISGPAAIAPPVMTSVGVISPTVPFHGISFPSTVPPTQPFPAAMPPMQQTFPPAMLQAGSYPAAAPVGGSYPSTASCQAVSTTSTAATSAATTSAATSQNKVSWYNCFYQRPSSIMTFWSIMSYCSYHQFVFSASMITDNVLLLLLLLLLFPASRLPHRQLHVKIAACVQTL